MKRKYEGNFNGEELRVGIICSRFNEFIVSKLLEGAEDALKRHNVREESIEIALVPGAFEIPFVAKKMAITGKYDVIITLGAVIRGETPHFDYVCSEVSKGVATVGLETGVPIIFGVLTVNTIDEAVDRAGTKSGNKGFEAAMSALEMSNLIKKLGE